MSGIFNSSKAFVDMKLKDSVENTLKSYKKFIESLNNNPPSNTQLQQFVGDNFEAFGSEYEQWTPPDFNPNPKIFDNIPSPWYKSWAFELNNYWKKLGRKQVQDVGKNYERYSIIPVPNPIIFETTSSREIYYWDNYWVVLGLLQSEMYDVSINEICL